MFNLYKVRRFFFALVLMACLFTPVQPAQAFPVARLDAALEQQIAALQQLYNNYVEKILTNLDKIKSIMALAKLPDDFKKLVAALDVQAKLKELIGQAQSLGNLEELINAADVGSALQTGKMDGVQLTEVDKDPAELMEAGDPTAAANLLYERCKRALEESIGLPASSGPNEGKVTKESTKTGDEKDAEDANKKSLEIAKNTIPMSFNNMIEISAATAAAGSKMNTNKEMFATSLADQVKDSSIMEITKVMAPYAADPSSKASYRYGISKIREQSESALKKAADLSKPEPSMALKAIAGLSAVLVEQQGLQNELLINMTDVMADDIKMSGLIALLELESYSNNVSQNTMRYIDIYNAISK